MLKVDSPVASPAAPEDDPGPSLPDFDQPEGMTSLGRTLVIKGELSASEHLIIEGKVEGSVTVPDHGVAIGRHATVSADILARSISVLGRATGRLIASDTVEVGNGAAVEGLINAATVTLRDGAFFKGTVDPARRDAALAVGRYRTKQRV